MKNKELQFSDIARQNLLVGVQTLNRAVSATLGPNGRNVIIQQDVENPTSTKDGVTVAKAVKLKDPVQNIGVQLVRQASIKTADEAGDGTTTSTVLASSIFSEGIESLSSRNAVEIKRGIELASREVIQELKDASIEITQEDQLKQVATISGNNDSEVGSLIASAMDKAGQDGVITIEESRTGETYLETVEGMQFNRGFKSPYFVTDNKTMTTTLDKPWILITDDKLTKAKDLLPLLEACSSQNKSLLIIADDVDGEAISTLVVNKMRGILSVAAVKAPEFGDRKKEMLEDIATITGGSVISKEKGMRLDRFDTNWLGKARKVTVGKDSTTIIDGAGTEDQILERVESIKSQIDNSTSPFEIEKLQERLGRMVGGVAVIHVGGFTEVEMKEKKDRVEDALHATRAALEEGILPGGGVALLRIYDKLATKTRTFPHPDQEFGYHILLSSITAPFYKILDNAIGNVEKEKQREIATSVLANQNFWYGYNPRSETFEDFLESGIIDPTKVTRLALENAVSAAGTMLITECVISSVQEEESTAGDGMNFNDFM